MNDRIKKLRQQSLDAQETISHERAVLLTEFYRSERASQVSAPVVRALAFRHILGNKTIFINPGELIVGERGPAPKATPTYPEICAHTLDDLNVLHERPKVSFKSSEETKKTLSEKILPFWKGRTVRDRIFEEVDQDWKKAYKAGVFTEFMEQRAPGHTVLDDKIYHKGMLDFKADIAKSISNLDFYDDPEAFHKREELRAMDIAAEAIIRFAERHAEKLDELIADNKFAIINNKSFVFQDMFKSQCPGYRNGNLSRLFAAIKFCYKSRPFMRNRFLCV